MEALLDDLPPEDVVAALAPVIGSERARRLDAVAAGRLGGVAVVLDDLRDPHNGGAVLRSCEAMGVYRVHVVSVKQRFRSSARVTQGCERWLTLQRHTTFGACLTAVRAAGMKLYAAVPGAERRLEALDPLVPTALAFGNEHAGLSPELMRDVDGEFAISTEGFSQSLNVSVAAAVSLYSFCQARRRALGRPGDLEPRELLALRARYYALGLRGARGIVERWRQGGRRSVAVGRPAR